MTSHEQAIERGHAKLKRRVAAGTILPQFHETAPGVECSGCERCIPFTDTDEVLAFNHTKTTRLRDAMRAAEANTMQLRTGLRHHKETTKMSQDQIPTSVTPEALERRNASDAFEKAGAASPGHRRDLAEKKQAQADQERADFEARYAAARKAHPEATGAELDRLVRR